MKIFFTVILFVVLNTLLTNPLAFSTSSESLFHGENIAEVYHEVFIQKLEERGFQTVDASYYFKNLKYFDYYKALYLLDQGFNDLQELEEKASLELTLFQSIYAKDPLQIEILKRYGEHFKKIVLENSSRDGR
ncbi:MAG: hypothetical protein AB8G05_19480 [Oligoflexales bacterium]